MEFIEVIDNDGNPTGQIVEREMAHDNNLLHNEISVFIINDNKEILLQKRSPNKRFNPNKWGLCSGHVNAGESLENATLRELEEELGLKFSLRDIKPFGKREFNLAATNSHIKYSYFIKTNIDIDDIIIQRDELSEIKWFKIDDVINMVLSHDESITIKENRLYLLGLLKEK